MMDIYWRQYMYNIACFGSMVYTETRVKTELYFVSTILIIAEGRANIAKGLTDKSFKNEF